MRASWTCDIYLIRTREQPSTLEGCFEGYDVQTFLLGEALSSVRVRLHDFPFSPEVLLGRIMFLFENSYLFKGNRYQEHVYDHEYFVEVDDADRSGGRFVSGKTEIYFK